jgi:hypothetical protein
MTQLELLVVGHVILPRVLWEEEQNLCGHPGAGGTSVIPALRKLRQEDLEFAASLGYIVKLGLKKKNQTTTKTNKLKSTWANHQH